VGGLEVKVCMAVLVQYVLLIALYVPDVSLSSTSR
jgi:hypothetical protein